MYTIDPAAFGAPIDAAMQPYLDAPGILVETRLGAVTQQRTTGVSDADSNQAATAGQTIEVGSQTKMMTSVVILQLVEEGHFSLDDKLIDHVQTDAINGIANIEDVTIRQLLSMKSGIPNYTDVPGTSGLPLALETMLENPGEIFGQEEALAIVDGLPADFAPGEGIAYSNTNYTLLGLLAETVTGNSLAAEMQARIFTPLGMNDTTMDRFGEDANRMQGYVDFGNGLTNTDAFLWDPGAEGGAISTTSDMIRFIDGLLVSRTLLPENLLNQMMDFETAVVNPDTGASISYGLGLMSYEINGQRFVGFNGATLGFSTSTLLNMETGAITSAAVNQGGADVGTLASEVNTNVDSSEVWTNFDADGNLVFAAATDLEIEETAVYGGNSTTVIQLDGLKLSFPTSLGDLDTSKISFTDGSTLWIGSDSHNWIDVLKNQTIDNHANNYLIGLDGHDRISGGHGDDKIIGGNGHDRLIGRGGDDTIDGGQGHDTIRGGRGNDTIDGGQGHDRLNGGRGNDVIQGGHGHDKIKGGSGNDTLDGGSGHDVLTGGHGEDVFVFSHGDGYDTITDFQAGHDVIDFSHLNITFDDLSIKQGINQSVEIQYGPNDILILTCQQGTLDEADFIF